VAGTKIGGQKAAATNKLRYGDDFYRIQGAKGGKASNTGGFAHPSADPVAAGKKGGSISKRGKVKQDVQA
jgi:hypothetical protein